ncbi:tetratricopeptide repeat protein [Romeria aff. gracilis LEGE 07310]|uniref:Tetratricopeptide repeat protein n=1 Tax=Vasconcelosia minhoensis LEGE 07310 TaxID=915328 RepID=A0A8J7DAV7_9CYAN|nr:tetratricopeptide repeat protein [Romeria gracilis]MBE9076882.1 tetratricopeptide repeat protein [Romeria aff. gracilis LEGE 07310]
MYELVAAALAQQDYRRAAQLLKQWHQAAPGDPLVLLYAAKLQEATLKLDAAEKNYLKLLKQATHPKLMRQAREGLNRVQQARAAQLAEAPKAVRHSTSPDDLGLLILEPPPEPNRETAAQGLAQVLKLDLYTARMQLPTRSLRLQRVGDLTAIQAWGRALREVQTPAFWASVADLRAIQVFQICYFQQLGTQPVIVCKNSAGQLGTIAFAWAEVSQRLSGQVPFFEQVADIGPWGKPLHKEKTQDYVQLLDLHLEKRQIILRLCDRTYLYAKAATPVPTAQNGNRLNLKLSSRIQWNYLLQHIHQTVMTPLHTDFTPFGTGALEFFKILPSIEAHLSISRRASSEWDQAFQLYSGLLFLKHMNLR